MANTMDKLAKELKAQMTASDERKPKPYDAQAEVLRVEDGTAWVHIPGGVEETPVRLTINAKKGDMVNIHVANGAAWITGNSTNPPTDDSMAIELNQKTSKNLFVLNEKVTNEFNNAWTEITQNSEEIKLKASQATVNGLGERLSTAETNITQNANAISLRATKTEVTDAKNAAIASANSTTDDKLTAYTKTADFSIAPDQIASVVSTKVGNNEVISKINQSAETIQIQASKVAIDGTATFNAIKSSADAAYDAKGAASDAVDNLQVGGRNLVRALDETKMTVTKSDCSYTYDNGTYVIRCTTAGGGSNFTQIYGVTSAMAPLFNNVSAGETVIFHVDSVVSSNAALEPRIYLDIRKADGTYIVTKGIYQTANNWINKFEIPAEAARYTLIIRMDQNKNAAVGDTLTVSGIKLEKGNKATDWTPAPEDVQAEIDAKKSVHTLASSLSFTYANILTYSNEGYSKSGGWTVSDANGVKVGDTVRIKVTASDMNNASVYVVGTVTAVSGNIVTMTSHGLDTTVIDGGHILTGTIDASKVNVSNLTVGAFGDGELAAGGTNLLRDTTFMGTWSLGSAASVSNGEVLLTGSSSNWNGFVKTSKMSTDVFDGITPYIWSFEYMTTAACTAVLSVDGTSGTVDDNSWARKKYYQFGSSTALPNTNGKWVKYEIDSRTYSIEDLTTTASAGDINSVHFTIFNRTSSGAVLHVRHVQFEKGKISTSWSPAPEDYSTGGRNYWCALDEKIRSIGKNLVSYTYDGNGAYELTCTTASTSGYAQIYTSKWIPCAELAGKRVVFHADSIVASNATADERIYFSTRNSNGVGTGSFYINADQLCKTVLLPATMVEIQLIIRIDQQSGAAVGDTLTVVRPTLELGCIPSNWTPASDDMSATATNYITSIDNAGIFISPLNQTPTTSAAGNSVRIDGTGMEVYKGGVSVAKYGDTSRIGKIAASNGNIRTNSTGMDLYVNTTKVGSFHQQTGYTPEDRAETYNNALFLDAAQYFAIRSGSTLKPMIETNGTEVDINFGGSSLITADDFNAAEGGGPVTFELWGHDSSEITDPDPDVDFSTFINVYGGIDDGDGGVTGVGIGVGDDGNQHGVWSSMKDRWLIGATNTGEIMCPGVYLNTTSGGSNVRILGTNADSFDYMMKRYVSSSRRYKTEIDDISDDALDPSRLYDARVVQFKYKDGYLGEDDQRNGKLVNGFIAEELDDIYPIAVQYENGLPEDWEPKFLIPPMLKLIQDQKKKIDELEARLEKLEKKL